MVRVVRSCAQSILKLVNSIIGMAGTAMILYAIWLIRVWQREIGDFFPFEGSDYAAPWYVLYLGVNGEAWDFKKVDLFGFSWVMKCEKKCVLYLI